MKPLLALFMVLMTAKAQTNPPVTLGWSESTYDTTATFQIWQSENIYAPLTNWIEIGNVPWTNCFAGPSPTGLSTFTNQVQGPTTNHQLFWTIIASNSFGVSSNSNMAWNMAPMAPAISNSIAVMPAPAPTGPLPAIRSAISAPFSAPPAPPIPISK